MSTGDGQVQSKLLVFKGGNALRFAHAKERTTVDLDFTAMSGFFDDLDSIRTNLDEIVAKAGRRHGIALKVQRAKRNPPGMDKTMPTYELKIGYRFPEDRDFATFRDSEALPSASAILIEISINDVVCETVECRVSGAITGTLRACSIEDIVAEKLRALLQQVTRNRTRPQDVLDIAVCCRDRTRPLDVSKIRAYLLAKAAARGIRPSAASFDAEVKRRGQSGYEALKSTAGDLWIPFEDAWGEVQALVASLGLPERTA